MPEHETSPFAPRPEVTLKPEDVYADGLAEDASVDDMRDIVGLDGEANTDAPRDFSDSIDDIIVAAEASDSAHRFDMMQSYVDGVLADVRESGLVTLKGETIDAAGIEERLGLMAEMFNKPTGEIDPVELLPKQDNLRAAFLKLLSNEATAAPLINALVDRELERVRVEKLTQSRTPRAIGGAAVEAVAVVTTELSEVVQKEVDEYRLVMRFYNESVREKDFSDAGEQKRRLYELTQTLSDEAKRALKLL